MTASGVPGPAGPAAVPMIVERDPPVPMDDGLILRGAGPARAPPGPRPVPQSRRTARASWVLLPVRAGTRPRTRPACYAF
jgi:hypothetical protein